jgi:hypothetical protein
MLLSKNQWKFNSKFKAMKKISRISVIAAITMGALFTSCKKDAFVEINVDPNTLYSVKPEDQFLAASIGLEDDFEAYYDDYRRIMWWMQMSTDSRGNRKNFTRDVSNFNQRYGKIFYGRVGPRLADIPQLISKKPADQQAAYVYEQNIAQILMAYYAFYVSDINGSIPYTEAFQARYGGTLTPKYDTQSELFATLDQQLKDAVAALKSTPSVPQKSLGNNDPFYRGDVSKWIKAGNATRLRIAMRMTKVDINRVKTIVTDVLSNPADQMTSDADSWVLVTPGNSFGGGGNWSPVGMRAPKPTMDFMVAKGDPRLRLFYSKNLEGEWVGSYTNPDSAAAKAALYARGDTVFSTINYRLFDATAQDVDGTAPGAVGNNFYPLITYADVCFMRAELAARGLTNEDAATWYNAGIEGSMRFYDKHAKEANTEGYAPITDAEIAAYLAKPEIAFDPAKALDQIATQAYINFYKNPNEAWALYKRTGMPNASTVLKLPVLTSDGAVNTIPRRAPLGLPDLTSPNAENRKAAYDQMATDPGFGQDANDAFGRVWWDKP